MELVETAKGLVAKAKAYSTRTTKIESELFVLREEIRAEANKIARIIDGPEQAVKNVAREVRVAEAAPRQWVLIAYSSRARQLSRYASIWIWLIIYGRMRNAQPRNWRRAAVPMS
jgi:hypothetical protein